MAASCEQVPIYVSGKRAHQILSLNCKNICIQLSRQLKQITQIRRNKMFFGEQIKRRSWNFNSSQLVPKIINKCKVIKCSLNLHNRGISAGIDFDRPKYSMQDKQEEWLRS